MPMKISLMVVEGYWLVLREKDDFSISIVPMSDENEPLDIYIKDRGIFALMTCENFIVAICLGLEKVAFHLVSQLGK